MFDGGHGAPLRTALLSIAVLSMFTAAEGIFVGNSTENQTQSVHDGKVSNKANEFHIGFMQNYVDPFLAAYSYFILERSALFITTDEPNDVIVDITYDGTDHIHVVEPGVVSKVQLRNVRAEGPTDRNRGIRIKAEGDSRVFVTTMDEELYSIEGYSAFPCSQVPHAARYDYYAVSVPRTTTIANMTADSAFLVVACNDNTTVTVTPTQEVALPEDPSRKLGPGESFTTVLHDCQTLYVESREDLTGSLVVSSGPLTFLSGHECGNVPYNVKECNKLVEQLPPTLTWGLEFFTAPTASRMSSDIIKIVVAENDTELAISCTSRNGTLSWNTSVTLTSSGGSTNFTTSSDEYCHIQSNKPALVVQFTPGQKADPSKSSYGDPFMVIVPAVSQYQNSITFTTLEGPALYFTDYANVYLPTQYFDYNSVQLDGNPISEQSWVPIQCVTSPGVCGYAAQVQINDSGVHCVAHSNPNATLGVTVYGLEQRNSLVYAYVGGLSLSYSTDPMIVEPLQTSYMILNGRSICFSCELTPAYVDTSQIRWDFSGSSGQSGSFLDSPQVKQLPNGTLCISNASVLESGEYTCSVESDSLTYSLSVLVGIVVQPPVCRPWPTTNQTVVLGIGMSPSAVNMDLRASQLEICCQTTLTADRVTWLANGEEILPRAAGYRIESDYLQIQGPFTDGCVVYTCQATFGTDVFEESSEVCYGRFGPPTSLAISGPHSVGEGASFSIECSAAGFPSPTFVWKLDLHSDRPLPSHAHDLGNGTLRVVAALETDTRYCCMAANERGMASTCRNLIILVPPEIQPPTEGQQPHLIPVPPGVTLPLPYNITVVVEIGHEVTVVETYRLEIHCTVTRGNPAPAVTWLHNGLPISAEDYQILSEISGETLVMESVSPVRDNGTFTCKAEVAGVGFAERETTVTVVEPPRLAKPSPPLHAPGNCRDLTNQTIATARIGLNLCILASPESMLYLDCLPEKGFPTPTALWFKDGESINSSNSSTYEIFTNGTLLIKNILHPIESSTTGVPEIMGLYTCFLSNIAGAANKSSYIVPFGDIPPETVATYYAPTQMELFDQLHLHLSTSMSVDKESLVLVSATGKLLRYEDYYPGRDFDGGEDTIPPRIMENMFDLVDFVPDGSSIITSDHNRGSLSMAYEFLLGELMVAPPDVDHDTLTEARTYLQELVTDIASPSNDSIPRLSLYLMYKNKYYQKKLEIEDQIDYQRRRLPGLRFSQWYERNGIILENEVKHAYYEWDVYGSKNDTEAWLDILNLQDHSKPLSEARSLLFATTRVSKYRDEKMYFPVEFFPSHWFYLLRNRVQESIDQLQYHLAELQTQKTVLEFTREFLETELRRRVLGFWETPPVVYSQLDAASFFLEHEVMNTERQRYRCLVTRNPIDCELYSYEYTLVLQLMEIFTDLYWEAEFINTATDHRDVSIPLVVGAISSTEEEIDRLDLIIRVAIIDSADRDGNDKDEGVESDFEQPSNFFFSTKVINQKEHNFIIPEQIQNRPLWYIDPISTSLTSIKLWEEYSHTLNHLNSMWTNVTAEFVKVDVHRRWFKPSLFEDNHLKLRNESILVSPGLVRPLENMRSMLANASYELPLYPASLILATRVELFVNLPFPFHTLPTLLRLSYDRHIRGGFGPFSFGPLFPGRAGGLKFQVQVRDNGMVIVLPGTQLVGYICNTVSKHPPEAHDHFSRKRRATSVRAMPAEGYEKGDHHDLSSSKFGQWLARGTRYSSSDVADESGEFQASKKARIAHLKHRSRGRSSYSERLQRAVSFAKAPELSQAEPFSVYSNLSAAFTHDRRERNLDKRNRYM